MKNWLICATVTEAARKIIEETGGSIETLSENVYEGEERVKPRILLVTINDALYHGMNKEYHYFSYTLSRNNADGTGSGICLWDDAFEAAVIYAWDGKNPNDPDLRRGLDPDGKLAWEVEDDDKVHMQGIIDELKEKKLARIPSTASQFWRMKGYPPKEYEEIESLFWRVLNDPEWEYKYNRIIDDETMV